MKKFLFIDRDGTLIQEPPDEQIDSLEKLVFMPYVFQGLGAIARTGHYTLIIVTNQDGLGTSSFPEETFHPAHQKMLDAFSREGIVFSEVLIDRSFAHENLPTRKPGTAMVEKFIGEADLANSYVIGDRLTDIQLAINMGCRAIYLRPEGKSLDMDPLLRNACALIAENWLSIHEFLQEKPRKATHRRRTKETDIEIQLNLDGTGDADIKTGLGFFDHMLEQIARHGQIDLHLYTQGDLHIDEHHTIEDTALALGETIAQALGDKRGIERYGYCLPMDDAEAHVSLDFGGRPWIVWEADFSRERIGDMPTEMFFHFFKSFSDAAKCNLHIKASGKNEHHKIEALFKAFAKAIRMAKKREGNLLPSTKGVL